ncbi:MAG: DUF421 domain-containing protein [Christensenellales bacterium]|jgi:uncharacterized membrane protein YcaP (DUF421 family)
MLNVIIKTSLIYFFAMFIMRLMGKRQAGELQPFELIIAVMIAEVASTPMDSSGVPITYGIVPIITLLILHNGIAFISMKSEAARAFFSGKPSIVINKGVVDKKELKKLNYNLNDLLVQLRGKNVMSISDVHYAVLETNGELSVMLKPQKRTLQPEDLNIRPQNPGFCYDIILDGKIKPENLKQLGFNENAVLKLLSKKNIKRVKDVFIATSDETGSVFIQDANGKQTTGSLKNG